MEVSRNSWHFKAAMFKTNDNEYLIKRDPCGYRVQVVGEKSIPKL